MADILRALGRRGKPRFMLVSDLDHTMVGPGCPRLHPASCTQSAFHAECIAPESVNPSTATRFNVNVCTAVGKHEGSVRTICEAVY
jgi:hypothetical protein